MVLTPDILNSLHGLFEDVWVSKGGEEINVTCPYCASRMGSPDSSGHLGLNFRKDAGHCVRCDWGTRGMRKWLKKMGFASAMPAATARVTLRSIREQASGRHRVPYQLGRVVLPSPLQRLANRNFEQRDAFAESLLDKGVSLYEARRNKVCYCDFGKYDGYVVFPFLEDGEILYWQARAAYPHLLKDSALKKRNPGKNEATLGKSYWLYGYDFAQVGGTAVLTEGTLDQITTQSWIEKRKKDEAGWYCCSLQGTAVSEPDPERHPLNSQLGKLTLLEPEEVIVLLDAEAWKKAEALAEHLYDWGFNARAVRLPKSDPNDLHDKPEIFDQTLGTKGLDNLKYRLQNIPVR